MLVESALLSPLPAEVEDARRDVVEWYANAVICDLYDYVAFITLFDGKFGGHGLNALSELRRMSRRKRVVHQFSERRVEIQFLPGKALEVEVRVERCRKVHLRHIG